MKPGDVVRVPPKAPHTFDAFRGETATVLDVRPLGGHPWARLSFENGRETWLPTARLELIEAA